MHYTFTTEITKEEHDSFVEVHEYCNLLQSYNWSKVKDNWKHLIAGVRNESGQLEATSLVLIKPLPLGFSMYYLPKGPVMDFKNKELMDVYFQGLSKTSKKDHCIFIKVDPGIHVNDYKSTEYNTNHYPETAMYLNQFKEIGANHQGFSMHIGDTIQPRFQSNVYQCENFEESLPRHTKRLIKDALKRNVEIEMKGIEFVKEFSRLVELTEERKGVHLRGELYFQKLCEAYPQDAKIFLAGVDLQALYQESLTKHEQIQKEIKECPENAVKKMRRLQDMERSLMKDVKEFKEVFEEMGQVQGKIYIAGVLSIRYGHTCEMLYAGMDQRFKKFMPQYKIYVENMKWAFAHGCKTCNMGGVEGTLDDGLTKFKDNFNPLINEFIGEFDIPVNKLLYLPFHYMYHYVKKKREKALGGD